MSKPATITVCIFICTGKCLTDIQSNVSFELVISTLKWTIWHCGPHRKYGVTLFANHIRSQGVSMYFILYVTVCWRAKVVAAHSDGYQGWLTAACARRSVCEVASVCGSYLGTLAWCHSRCHCWCRSLWQRCPLLSSHIPADMQTLRFGPRWCRH